MAYDGVRLDDENGIWMRIIRNQCKSATGSEDGSIWVCKQCENMIRIKFEW